MDEAEAIGRPVRMLVMLPSMIAFRDIGFEQRTEGVPDYARIGAAMARHGIETLSLAA
ncbi:hypothetical protein [Rhizobium halophilum]|uniref:hypothetical protein n=1 Tax=Rhizobium halophilum TaxID=2846852 RepID=UPI001EFEF05C|nr:hypothetical protein [Rhizobium halophilum]MCF6368126.1 hypothetical protein [Rhizobium halophilum]